MVRGADQFRDHARHIWPVAFTAANSMLRTIGLIVLPLIEVPAL